MKQLGTYAAAVALLACAACGDGSNSAPAQPRETDPIATPPTRPPEAPITKPPTPVVELAAGAGFVAARLESGSIYWWGHWLDAPDQAAPLPVLTPFGSGIASMSGAHGHSTLCMVSTAGSVFCQTRMALMYGKGWGDSWARQWNTNLTSSLEGVVAVGASEYEGCALRNQGDVVCWSYLDEPNLVPHGKALVRVDGIGKVRQLAVGSGHACALNESQHVWCWGSGNWGELGNADYDGPSGTMILDKARGEARIEGLAGPQPARRVSGVEDVTAVVAGGSHTCAVRDGQPWCWGFNASGQLGDGTHKERSKPAPVAGVTDVVELAAGRSVTCARQQSGAVMCWGHDLTSNTSGNDFSRDPWTVPGLDDAVTIAVGDIVACAARTSGAVACWGSNRYGSLGNGGGEPSELTHVRWDLEPPEL